MQDIELLTHWVENINNNKNFSFVKFGDGEFNCMTGVNGLNCDGHKYSPALSKKLHIAWEHLIKYDNIYIGEWTMNYTQLRKKLAKKHKINYINFEILLTRKLYPEKYEFFKSVKNSPRKKIFIGPERLSNVMRFLNVNKMITIPLTNAFNVYDKILNKALEEQENNAIYIFASGMMTKPLISDLLKQNPCITCLDVGSGFDILFVGATREGQNISSVEFYKELTTTID